MAESVAEGLLIQEGDHVVMKKEDVYKAVQVQRRKKVIFEKQWIYLDNAVGKHYGTTFEITAGGNLQPKRNEVAAAEPKEAGADNRNIIDDGKSQKLTRDDIEALKEKGIKGQEIVQQLIENSTTFRDKTEFAQEKYIKKKKKKYEAIITIVKPSTRILSMMYYAREPGKICQLRYDTLAQMLTLGNIHAGSQVIVMETCAGLVLGSVMERMGGYGSVIQMYPGTGPVRAATDCFGFPKSFYKTLYEFPLSKVESLISGTFSGHTSVSTEQDSAEGEKESNGSALDKQEPAQEVDEDSCPAMEPESTVDSSQPENQGEMEVCGEENSEKDQNPEKKPIAMEKKRKQDERRKRESEAAVLLQNKNADGLIIASRFHPAPLLLTLLGFVSPSRPFVVYCQYKEPLLECYTKLRERGGVINLKLSETWLRNYQVLPNRSHPKLVMSGGGGYLLHGITVAREASKPSSTCPERTEEPAPKKLKLAELES
ncbi:PREDICTED: tRNA (adenine(58)-N(1))-methyltransferase non-catalytic subunit TRM6 [Nanorana parkeri]|uniref:tRNA (adenine(58)-N(1))-methyltransferase non-catalytic subunit TRM6 n=1 Tax=Nanorana parkeri TaxID=125878 RepID=UPI00085458ED|nr:PREDICTED: tRNA (adenine(58)-N(1))-methyltransferase non-catalytic subunit TRM6 [Nanorana parkeri]